MARLSDQKTLIGKSSSIDFEGRDELLLNATGRLFPVVQQLNRVVQSRNARLELFSCSAGNCWADEEVFVLQCHRERWQVVQCRSLGCACSQQKHCIYHLPSLSMPWGPSRSLLMVLLFSRLV